MLRLLKEATNALLKRVVVDWPEYSSEPLDRVVKLVKARSRPARDEWKHEMRSVFHEEILKFYLQSKYHIRDTTAVS